MLCNNPLVARRFFRYNGQAARKGRRGRGFSSILQGKGVRPMLVTLVLSVIIAVVILVSMLLDIEAKAKKSACEDFEENHKR